MSRIPRLAVIAHDGKKADLVAFATFNRDRLSDYDLIGTGATADLLENKVGLAVERVSPGPEGGDVQIASDRHGKVTIVDREKLEAAACECYTAVTFTV